MPGQTTEFQFYLLPISKVFHSGERIRIAIMGADADNRLNLPITTGDAINVFHDPHYQSVINLPIVSSDQM